MKRCLTLALTLVTAFALTGCGTLFHGERRDQKASKEIDVLTFALDCVGILFGIVPGVVALIVDYSNGTIYYSTQEVEKRGGAELDLSSMKSIKVADMSREGIARALSAELGREVAPESIVF